MINKYGKRQCMLTHPRKLDKANGSRMMVITNKQLQRGRDAIIISEVKRYTASQPDLQLIKKYL